MNHPDVLLQQAADVASRRQGVSRRRRLAREARTQREVRSRARSRRWRRVSGISHATAVAYLALLLATSGTAVAATGGTFILGKANTASSVSSLTSSTGPALSLRAPSGSAPLQVNRNVKVTNLNADLLDGKDSTAFVTKASFDALRADLIALQGRVTTLEARQAEHEAVAREVAAVRELLAGVTREQVDGRPTIRFSDVNLQLVNGTGSTGGTPNGLGNLIVGYSAQRSPAVSRAGSHYLVIGDGHQWTRHGGLIAGQTNTATGVNSSVLGGSWNTALGTGSTVTGGESNIASGSHASVSGGGNNRAAGQHSSVSGGYRNLASVHDGSADSDGYYCGSTCDYTSVTGGTDNTASGPYSIVTGGTRNVARGWWTSVTGGKDNVVRGDRSSILGGTGRNVTGVATCHPACA